MNAAGDAALAPRPDLEFYIPATTSLQERRPRTLKHGNSFALLDHNGDVLAGPMTPEGLFLGDTRHLSSWRLEIEGQRPLLLGSTIRDDNTALTVDLTNPDLFEGDRIRLAKDTIHVNRVFFLFDKAGYERIGVRNYAEQEMSFTLGIRFGADFADLFEIRGIRRRRRGTIRVDVLSESRVRFAYEGLDGITRVTTIAFDPAPTRLEPDGATFEMRLASHQHTSIFVRIALQATPDEPWVGPCYLAVLRAAQRELRASTARAATISTSNELFNAVLCRSMADIYMLLTDTPHGPYPFAGVPWFSTVFGRDGLLTSLQLLAIDPDIARGVLRVLAAEQAREFAPQADAEPGKIVHEMREGELARLGEVPLRRYYGSIDSTPLFVMLAGRYFARTGDRDTVEALWPAVEAALNWIDSYGDRDGDGFLEYGRRSEHGLVNQGWKDSHDAVFGPDGRLAEGPVALVEVQAYAYAAKKEAARLARALGDRARAERLTREADALRERFEHAFWCEELGFYALALDGDKRPLAVLTSNAGHVLFAEAALPERAARVAERLMSPAFFSGWGIRTVARGEARYNPMSYHNGSVWPHDNALIAAGLARYGFAREAMTVMRGIFDAATYADLRRLPELFCGFQRQTRKGPTAYPVACSPQAWAAAAPFAFLEACLGLSFHPESREVHLHRPRLPDFLEEVRIRNLRLDDASVDLLLRRYGDEVAVNVLERRGEIDVRVRL